MHKIVNNGDLMETDLNKIKKLSEEREEENWKFRTFLKCCDLSEEKIDSIVHELFRSISERIDCKSCANCCKEALPVLDQADIKRFSEGLGISVFEFQDKYLVKDDEEPEKYTFNKKPCPFLKDNICSYYEYRPKDCRSFPHLHKKEFTSRLMNIVYNCSLCPIVYNVYELLKGEVWHNRYDDYDL